MFDLSKDFDPDATLLGNDQDIKRKREDETVEELRQHESGAGNKKPKFEMKGIGENIRKAIGPDLKSSRVIFLGGTRSPEGGDGEGEETKDSALTRLRRGQDLGGERNLQEGRASDNDEKQANGLSIHKSSNTTMWIGHRYQSILGVVPLTSQAALDHVNNEEDSRESPLEVCLVERPQWDLDLPPRYDGDRDWDR
jgi:U3 small nucleolar RNA-associated protein 4